VDRKRLRATFEEVPELYDRARPTYPALLFDDLSALAGLEPGADVLEIGPGTGKATLALAERGFRVLCVELGAGLVDVARRNLAQYSGVEVVHADFEEWESGGARFDAVVAFTAFHWVDPDVRFAKSAALLRPGGSLAVVDTKHVLPEGGDRFWADVQADYEAVEPSEDNRPPPRPDDVPELTADEIAASGRFHAPVTRRYLWDVTYGADEYVAVLDTYSGHRSMPDDNRRRLFELIRRRIASRPSGTVTKTYLFTLNVARRR
jgi:SAM-dependent methyltransferase